MMIGDFMLCLFVMGILVSEVFFGFGYLVLV